MVTSVTWTAPRAVGGPSCAICEALALAKRGFAGFLRARPRARSNHRRSPLVGGDCYNLVKIGESLSDVTGYLPIGTSEFCNFPPTILESPTHASSLCSPRRRLF